MSGDERSESQKIMDRAISAYVDEHGKVELATEFAAYLVTMALMAGSAETTVAIGEHAVLARTGVVA